MSRRYLLGADPLLTVAEAAAILGCERTAVTGWAAEGHLTWTTEPDGVRRYPQSPVAALAARVAAAAPPPPPLVLLSRREASAVLGVGTGAVSRYAAAGKLGRVPGHGTRCYPEASVLALRAELDARERARGPLAGAAAMSRAARAEREAAS
jgi:hypothetical protein